MMTKLILAGAAALVLSTGAAVAAQPAADYSTVQAQSAQATPHYAYMPQQQGSFMGYMAQPNTRPNLSLGHTGNYNAYSGPTAFGGGGNG